MEALEHTRPEPGPAHTPWLLATALGLLLGLPWLALGALGAALAGLPQPAFALFEALARYLPGGLVTAVLEVMVGLLQGAQVASTDQAGKAVETVMAYLAGLALAAVVAVVGLRLERGRPVSPAGLVTGLLLGAASLPAAGLTGWGAAAPLVGAVWSLALGVAWGLALGWGVNQWAARAAAPTDEARRAFLLRLAGASLLATGAGAVLARWLGRPAVASEQPQRTARYVPQPTPTPPPRQAFVPLPGTRPEVSPLEDFYRIDINLSPTDPERVARVSQDVAERLARAAGVAVPPERHLLTVEGLVERPRVFGLSQLYALPSVEFYATLECISNRIGGDLIDTTTFRGLRLRDVLEPLGLRPETVDLRFTCADGYTESLPLAWALDERTVLVYAMGGQPLTPEHGFPLRLYTPDRFGMKNPKWLVRIEAIDEDYRGYWEQRGWSEEAWVKTTSVIDVALSPEPGVIEAGGIAFAGARGVAGVEVQVDDGPWVPAELDRALSSLAWVLWRARVQAAPGRRELRVRAIDGTGEVQDPRERDPFPEGATGYHSLVVEVQG